MAEGTFFLFFFLMGRKSSLGAVKVVNKSCLVKVHCNFFSFFFLFYMKKERKLDES